MDVMSIISVLGNGAFYKEHSKRRQTLLIKDNLSPTCPHYSYFACRYYQTNDVQDFRYDRPFHKGQKNKECEFAVSYIK